MRGQTTSQCALCTAPAAVWCKNDSAYLCQRCDLETHATSLAMCHERIPVDPHQGEAPSAQPDLLALDDTAASIPSLGFLLDTNTAVDAAVDAPTQADLASLLAFDDPLFSLDFGGVDLGELMVATEQPSPGGRARQEQAAAAPLPRASPFSSSWGPQSTSSSASDAVVPVLPPSPSSARGPELLLSQPGSPLSPHSRVVTTGGGSLAPLSPRSPMADAVLARALPVQASSATTAAFLPSSPWAPSATALKPAPVTTNAAASSGVQPAGHPRKREAPLLAGAPRATARLARMATEATAGVAAGLVATPAAPAAVASAPAPAGSGSGTGTGTAGAPPSATPFNPPSTATGAVPYHIAHATFVDTETRADKLARYRAKKARRNFGKKIRYQTRKDYAEVRPRIKGRFVSPEEYAAWAAQQRQEQQQQGVLEDSGVQVVPSVKGR